VVSINSVCREHHIPIDRDYGPIKSFKLTLNHSAFYTVLHHRDGLITNLLNKMVNKHKLTVYLISLVTSFSIKSHSWDLQSQRLGINHSVLISISTLFPLMLLSLAFLLVPWSKNMHNSFMISQSSGTYTGLNKLTHNIVHNLTIKICSLLEQ
jgi:hypothetical protein